MQDGGEVLFADVVQFAKVLECDAGIFFQPSFHDVCFGEQFGQRCHDVAIVAVGDVRSPGLFSFDNFDWNDNVLL